MGFWTAIACAARGALCFGLRGRPAAYIRRGWALQPCIWPANDTHSPLPAAGHACSPHLWCAWRLSNVRVLFAVWAPVAARCALHAFSTSPLAPRAHFRPMARLERPTIAQCAREDLHCPFAHGRPSRRTTFCDPHARALCLWWHAGALVPLLHDLLQEAGTTAASEVCCAHRCCTATTL